MTMPAPIPPVQIQTIELPAPTPGAPMLTRMISDPLFPPEAGAKAEPLTWVVSLAHPLVPDMKVIRMFVEDLGIAVYSVSADGGTDMPMRNLVPMERTRLVEEVMPLEVFADELERAEADAASEDDEDEDPAEAAPQNEPKAAPEPDVPPAAAAEPLPNSQPDAS